MNKEIAQLKDAINHCEKVVCQQELNGCKECAEDHLQLAIWLRELIGYKMQNSDLESVRQELLERGDEMVSFRDLVERFDEVEETFKGIPWNLKQIYNNFNILVGEKPNNTGKTGYWFVDERPESDRKVICSTCEKPIFRFHKMSFDWRPEYCPHCGSHNG